MLNKNVITPFEILKVHRTLKEEINGIKRFEDNTKIDSDQMILLIAKCIHMKRSEIAIIKKAIGDGSYRTH